MAVEATQTRQLGNSDMSITPIGVGAWAMGGGGLPYSWGAQDDNDSIRAVHHAIDVGINWIDTAAGYGNGHSEEVVGQALKGRGNRPYVFTKCSLTWDDGDDGRNAQRAAESLRQQCEDSLRRLQMDTIDLYQVHWPNPDHHVEDGWSALADLQAEGKIRYLGASNFSVDQMQRAMAIAPITSLQPPYSIIRPGVEETILPFALANNVGVIVYSPMQAGLLTGKMTRERVANFPQDDWRVRNAEFQEPRLTRNLALQDFLVKIGQRHGRSAAEVAIAWTLHNPAVTAAIVGARNPEQIDGFLGAMTFRLSEAEFNEIQQWVEAYP